MRTNLNTILAVIGVSFSAWFTSSPISTAQTWYDSEGREIRFDGRIAIRKEVEKEKTPEMKAEHKEVTQKDLEKQEIANPIIPKSLELRPELSTESSRRIYQIYHPYYSYPHYGHGYHQHYRPYYHGCYRPSGIYRNSFYLR